MLKTILLGGAFAVALPALAQVPATHAPVNAGTVTTTAHDPLQTQDDATIQSTSTPATNASAAGRVSTTSPGIRAGLATPTDNCTLGVSRTRHARNRCARTNGGSVTTAGTTASGGANWGSNAGPAYTGIGGPDAGARTYPRCSRTVRDSCAQTGRQ